MTKFVKFFKTSPLTRVQLAMLLALLVPACTLIIGGIYAFVTKPKDFTYLIFVAVGILAIGIIMILVNPKACENWWVANIPDDKEI